MSTPRHQIKIYFGILSAMPTAQPCVYVIELNSTVLKNKKFLEKNLDMKKGKLCVYVGSTGIDPQQRFEQHKRGYKANKYVKKFGTCLRMDLVPKYKKPFKNSTESEAAEARHAMQCECASGAMGCGRIDLRNK